MPDKKYREICDKLGFEPSEYDPTYSGTEDDRYENPFLKLTGDEIMYLWDNGYLDKKK